MSQQPEQAERVRGSDENKIPPAPHPGPHSQHLGKKAEKGPAEMGGERVTTGFSPRCGSDTAPHDQVMFCFHRAVLGLAGRLFVLAKGSNSQV